MPKIKDGEVRPIAGGKHVVVRAQHVETNDPDNVVIAFDTWESTSVGEVTDELVTVAPSFEVTVPMVVIADGGIDLDNVMTYGKDRQVKQAENIVQARAKLAALPKRAKPVAPLVVDAVANIPGYKKP